MNEQRRQLIREIKNEITSCKIKLQKVLDEELMAFENMPENLQCSLRGSASEEAIDIMEESIEKMENITDELANIF